MAKPDAPGEEGIEAAREQERRQQQEQQQQQKGSKAEPKPNIVRPRQDSLDLQRAAGEGMAPPPSER